MNIILLGPPGSGKGTQSKFISEKFHIEHSSTGDMLREVTKSNTTFGNKIKGILGSGLLVSDDVVNEIVENKLSSTGSKGIILDGYPRTVAQANFLNKILGDNVIVLYLKINTDNLVKRIEGRFSCSQCAKIYNKFYSLPLRLNECDNCGGSDFDFRADDNSAALINRLKNFDEQTAPLIEYYSQKNMLNIIDASQDIEKVSKDILAIIKNY